MPERAAGDLSDARLAGTVVPAIVAGFDRYQAEFMGMTRRAKVRFERCDWRGAVADAAERLDLYGHVIDHIEREVRSALGERVGDRNVWVAMKTAYAILSSDRADYGLAETFFNSVTRRIFATVGVDRNIEFADSDFRPPPSESPGLALRIYGPVSDLAELVATILRDCSFDCEFEDSRRDARLVANRLAAGLQSAGGSGRVDRAEIIPALFCRRKGAYLFGRLYSGPACIPLGLALLNSERGIVIDAVLTDSDDISIVFSFARSHFHAELDPAIEAIRYLKLLMPKKPIAELYIAMGHHKHGKTELYRDLLRHLRESDELFVFAPGIHGMVMVVFTLPGYDVVFKVIRDRFPAVKPMTPRDVRRTYRIVFHAERAGRLVEAQEFEHLEFDRQRFAPDLIEEFRRDTDETVEVTSDLVIVHHAYVERRVTPLDMYLRDASDEAARVAVNDFGQAIKDLAANGIFPGELLPKNFGVTRHSRIVCYDYDELSFLTDFTFRKLPPPRFDEDELSDESWFGVGQRDLFPEEFRRFIGLPAHLLEVLGRSHGEIFDVQYWHNMQLRVTSGEIIDLFPYDPSRRLHKT
ncbi:MAG TPA: bifunctional isocitrate dehydrogenase kinase/phosphatase [Candidatus Dormibacteraeota bacterium]|nr:bifunctional isocitrate dehydrogenase kinase/phosphatase [Candidatus Dormibacteraeota bacterium]